MSNAPTAFVDTTVPLIKVGWAERYAGQDASSPPRIIDASEPNINITLAVSFLPLPGGGTPAAVGVGDPTGSPLPALHAFFTRIGAFYDATGSGAWIFQESADAPAASSHAEFPPPLPPPARRPHLFQVYNVPRTVPIGTHDKVLFFLGGVQRCDLPVTCRPMMIDPDEVVVAPVADAAEIVTDDVTDGDRPQRRGRRREAPAAPPTAPPHVYRFANFDSRKPAFPFVESRSAKGPFQGMMRFVPELLLLRGQTTVDRVKSNQLCRLTFVAKNDCYHTFAYRRHVFWLVKEGKVKLVATCAEAYPQSPAVPLTKDEGAASLPWDANGEIK